MKERSFWNPGKSCNLFFSRTRFGRCLHDRFVGYTNWRSRFLRCLTSGAHGRPTASEHRSALLGFKSHSELQLVHASWAGKRFLCSEPVFASMLHKSSAAVHPLGQLFALPAHSAVRLLRPRIRTTGPCRIRLQSVG